METKPSFEGDRAEAPLCDTAGRAWVPIDCRVDEGEGDSVLVYEVDSLDGGDKDIAEDASNGDALVVGRGRSGADLGDKFDGRISVDLW